jgi:hypothetical protein
MWRSKGGLFIVLTLIINTSLLYILVLLASFCWADDLYWIFPLVYSIQHSELVHCCAFPADEIPQQDITRILQAHVTRYVPRTITKISILA